MKCIVGKVGAPRCISLSPRLPLLRVPAHRLWQTVLMLPVWRIGWAVPLTPQASTQAFGRHDSNHCCSHEMFLLKHFWRHRATLICTHDELKFVLTTPSWDSHSRRAVGQKWWLGVVFGQILIKVILKGSWIFKPDSQSAAGWRSQEAWRMAPTRQTLARSLLDRCRDRPARDG